MSSNVGALGGSYDPINTGDSTGKTGPSSSARKGSHLPAPGKLTPQNANSGNLKKQVEIADSKIKKESRWYSWLWRIPKAFWKGLKSGVIAGIGVAISALCLSVKLAVAATGGVLGVLSGALYATFSSETFNKGFYDAFEFTKLCASIFQYGAKTLLKNYYRSLMGGGQCSERNYNNTRKHRKDCTFNLKRFEKQLPQEKNPRERARIEKEMKWLRGEIKKCNGISSLEKYYELYIGDKREKESDLGAFFKDTGYNLLKSVFSPLICLGIMGGTFYYVCKDDDNKTHEDFLKGVVGKFCI